MDSRASGKTLSAAGHNLVRGLSRADRRPSGYRGGLLLLGAACLFLALAALPFDEATLNWFAGLAPHGSYMRRVFKMPAHLFAWWTFAGLAVLLLAQPARKRLLTGFGVALVGCAGALHALKLLIGRARPDAGFLHGHGAYYFDAFGDPRLQLDSLPSGHAAMTALLLVLLGLYFPRSRWLLVLPAVVTCLGRVAIERHFLSDVLAGAGLALLWMHVVVGRLGPEYYPRLSFTAGRGRLLPASRGHRGAPASSLEST